MAFLLFINIIIMIHTLKIHKTWLVEWKKQKLLDSDYIINIRETKNTDIVEVTVKIKDILI